MTLTTAEAALIAEVVHETIVDFKEARAVGRQLMPVSRKNTGDSVKVVKEGAWPAAEIIPEGAEIPILQPTYSEEAHPYDKIAYRTQITREMIDDARWDMVKRNAIKAGEQIAKKETFEVVKQLRENKGITFKITGAWGGADADEIGDISTMIGELRNVNYIPDILGVNPKDYAHLAGLDEFIHAEKGGNISVYEVGSILELKVIATPEISDGKVLMIDYDQAGILYERQELRQEGYSFTPRLVEGQVYYERIKPAVLAPSAIIYASTY
jgi:HK97 family phage major capsid protein